MLCYNNCNGIERPSGVTSAPGVSHREVTPMTASNYTPSQEERFWSKVDKSGNCWLWQGYRRRSNGYGTLTVRPRGTLLAHRIAWEVTSGPIPAGLYVCHHCDTPACVNPAHLFLGTQQDNMTDMRRKGRGARGEQNNSGKLTPDDVRAIRRAAPATTLDALGKQYGVTRGAIWHIVHRRTWRHID